MLTRRLIAALSLAVASIALPSCGNAGSSDSTASSSTSQGTLAANASVERVVDGDTIIAAVGGRSVRVRMIGFNTPESVDPRRPVECFGKEASKHLDELAPAGTPIRLEVDAERNDRYGRTLAYVYRAADGEFLNLRMVEDGYAHALTIAPNVTYAEQFRNAERLAREAGLGLWSAC